MEVDAIPVAEGEIEHTRTLFRMAFETRMLLNKLRASGDEVSYEELSKVAGVDVQKEGYSNLKTARTIMQREDGVVWDVKRGVGLVRLKHGEIVESGSDTRSRIHKTAEKGLKRLECADYSQLTRPQQVQYNAEMSVHGVLCSISSNKSFLKAERASGNQSRQLNIGETLELFGSS